MNEPLKKVKFHYLVPGFYFPKRNMVKMFLLEQIGKEGKEVEAINYIFCSDDYLFKLNSTYLNHNTLTDIITFELSQKGEALLADIYISIDRVKENSISFHKSFINELLRVMFHGSLHLIGYRDKNKNDIQKMRRKEEEFLNLFSFHVEQKR